MLHEQFEYQNAARTMENERFELKNVCLNGSFQLQFSANTAENGQNSKSKQTTLNGKNIIPKTIPDHSENAFLSVLFENGRGPPRVWYFIIIFPVQFASKGILGHTQNHIRCYIGHVCDSRLYSHCIPIFDAFPLSPIFKQSLFLPIFALLIVLMWNSRSPIWNSTAMAAVRLAANPRHGWVS